MRWYRKLIATKWDYSARRGPRRPPVILLQRKLVVRMAIENPRWDYDRIEGEIRKLGYRLSRLLIALLGPKVWTSLVGSSILQFTCPSAKRCLDIF